jgi:N-acetylglucosaminyldiphosphoundecaprenol N-acetyl-beta-D-mannosaminyltransferase
MLQTNKNLTCMTVDIHKSTNVLGCNIDALTWQETINTICNWGLNHESRYVTLCNVHSNVKALLNKNHRTVLNTADMTTPDGMPITWVLRKLGFPEQQRINGPDLMWAYCEKAEKTGQKIFFYGSTNQVLSKLEAKLRESFPNLQIVGMHSPPFRDLTAEESSEIDNMLNASNANIIFVGLGCPRQEQWMFEHRGKVNAVMLGVGAAFNYHAGTIKRAPIWMQNSGLEWLHRLASDPMRLWKRYLFSNPVFIIAITAQLLGIKKFKD